MLHESVSLVLLLVFRGQKPKPNQTTLNALLRATEAADIRRSKGASTVALLCTVHIYLIVEEKIIIKDE